MDARSILIVGINYWPEQTGIAPYTTGLARALAARGWDVTVECGMPHYPEWRVADGYGRAVRREERDGAVRVRRFGHYVPGRQSAVRRALYEGSFLVNVRAAARDPRPDVVLGVVPSLSGGVLAAAAAKRHRVPYGLLFQDLMANAADQSGIAGGGRVAGAIRAVEGGVARGATGVAIVSEGFRPHLEAVGVAPSRIVHLPNWSHVARPTRSRAELRAALGWEDDVQVVLHAGNMGLKQGLEHVVEAAGRAAARGARTRFVLMGGGSQRAALRAQAAGCPAIAFLDPCPAEDFADVLAAADVLLVHERASVVDMSLPSKLTSYFAVGRPVVAAGSPAGGTAREVMRSGAGLTVPGEDPEALLAALARLDADPALAERLGGAGPPYAAANLAAAATLDRAEAFLIGVLGRHRVAERRSVEASAAAQPVPEAAVTAPAMMEIAS